MSSVRNRSSGIHSPECKALQVVGPQLKNAIQYDIDDLSLQLLSRDIVNVDNFEDFTNQMISTHQRASNLLRVLQSRVGQNPMNYAMFISILENKSPRGYYHSVISELNRALTNAHTHAGDLYGSSTANHIDSGTTNTSETINLRKYYGYIIIFTGINIVMNIILRLVIVDGAMVTAATAAQVLLYVGFIFILMLGVIMKDKDTIEAGIFGLGLTVGITVFLGIILFAILTIAQDGLSRADQILKPKECHPPELIKLI